MRTTDQSYQLEAAVAKLLSRDAFPRRWYQHKWGIAIGAGVATYGLLHLSLRLFGLHPPHLLGAVSATVSLLGFTCDILTTKRIASLAADYHERGVEPSFYETNPLLPEQPTLRQLLFHPTALIKLGVVIGAFFVPLAAWGIAGASLMAALSNHRYRQQAVHELQLHDLLQESLEWEKEKRCLNETSLAIPTVTG